MRWTNEDQSKFFKELVAVIEANKGTPRSFDRMVNLISGTLLLYDCPADNIDILLTIERALDLCNDRDAKKKLASLRAKCTRAQFLAIPLTLWMAKMIADNNPEEN